ncbi:MAG: glycosyltransferase family 39 protein, partial [Phycisphaerae bacterium]
MPVTPAQSPTQKLLWADALLLFVAAALLVGMRLHAFDLPLETDECNYIYTAARLLAGDQLYTDVWDHQPPGIFAFFAVVIALFGDTQPVFRWLATAACLTSLLLLVLICRHTAGRWAGYLAALLYALISADPGTAGEGCNREIFMNSLALA